MSLVLASFDRSSRSVSGNDTDATTAATAAPAAVVVVVVNDAEAQAELPDKEDDEAPSTAYGGCRCSLQLHL